jgi:hypothetical protein
MPMTEEEKLKWAMAEIAARASEEYLIGTPYEFGMWRRRRARRQAVRIGKCEVIALIERVKQGARKCAG